MSWVGPAFKAGGNIAGSYLGSKSRSDAAQEQFERARFRPFNVSSPFGSAKFGDSSLDLSLSPELEGFNRMFMDESEDLFGQATEFDLRGFTREQLDLLRDLAAPQERNQRLGLENRLFSQGRLGSTGGAQQYGQLLQAQNQSDLQRQLQALQLGMTQQDRLFQQAQGLFGNAINVQQLPMGLGEMGGDLGYKRSVANAAASGLFGGAAETRGNAIAGGLGSLGGALGSIFGGGGGLSDDWGSVLTG